MSIETVRIQVNGTWHAAGYNADDDLWEVTLTAPGTTSFNLPGGFYPVTAEATNSAGTTTTVTTSDPDVGDSLKLVVREIIKPTITVTAPTQDEYVGTTTPVIAFELRDEPGGSGIDISTVTATLDGTPLTVSSTQVENGYDCTATTDPLADGGHTLRVNVSDNDGNASTESVRTFTVDTAPPVLTVTNPPDGYITATPALTITGATNDVTSPTVTVTITLNGDDLGEITLDAGAFSAPVTLIEGENIIVVTATDTAGRQTTISRAPVLDTTEPQFESITITPNPADAGASVIIRAVIR